jgi:hypothetical protein
MRPMSHWKSRFCSLAAALMWPVVATCADDDGRGLEIGWLMFGDLYYVPSFHNEEGDDAAGAVMRRAYLTFDADFGTHWFGRLRFEANQSGEFENYDFEADFKDLYVGRDFGEHRLILGLSPTPTFDVIESLWGLRYLAKTPMDLQGLPSRDTGIALRGPLSADGKFRYRLMFGDGDEFGTDSGDGYKFMSAVSWHPDPRWTIDLFADYEVLPGPADRRTLQGFVGYETDALRWGLQYSHQDRQEDPPVELASAFLVAGLGSRSNAILRVDRLFEPSAKGDDIDYLPFDPSAKATMLIAGLEFRYGTHYALTPNAVIKRYDENDAGERPDTDVQLRLTLFLDFE